LTLEEITGKSDFTSQINWIKNNRLGGLPDVEYIAKQLDITKHDVSDNAIRQDKPLDGGGVVKVNRVPIPFQKRIVNNAVAFAFGNPVLWSESKKENSDTKFNAFEKALDLAKYSSVDVLMGLALKSYTEAAELWYILETSEDVDYIDFTAKAKFRCAVLSPEENELYPVFDEFGDMTAFGRRYVRRVDGKEFYHFDIYTQTLIYKFIEGEEALLVGGSPIVNKLDKIPIVYIKQSQTEFKDVEYSIRRLEYLLSNFADCNDYHGSPSIVVRGELINIGKKGEQGKIIQMGEQGTAEYLSWNQAPESVKLEIETQFKVINSFTQTSDVSFDSVKGIGNVSGIALKLLFTDSHLKVVLDRSLIYNSWFERRASIVKALLGKISSKPTEYEKLKPSFEIRPFMIDDEAELINKLVTATAGKPIMSTLTAIKDLGKTDNPEAELLRIEEENNIPVTM
jgi:SPP1 family phage portal protein